MSDLLGLTRGDACLKGPAEALPKLCDAATGTLEGAGVGEQALWKRHFRAWPEPLTATERDQKKRLVCTIATLRDVRPNVEANPGRGGRRCKAGLRPCYYWRSPALQRLP